MGCFSLSFHTVPLALPPPVATTENYAHTSHVGAHLSPLLHEAILRKKHSAYHLNRDVVVSKRNGDLKEMSIEKGGMGDMG